MPNADQVFRGFLEDWIPLACPTVQMPEKFAAALMCTQPPDLHTPAPWPVFMIRLPFSPLEGVDFVGVRRIAVDPVAWEFCAWGRHTEVTHAWFHRGLDAHDDWSGPLLALSLSDDGSSITDITLPPWKVAVMRLALGACAWATQENPRLAGKPRPPRARVVLKDVDDAFRGGRGICTDYVIGRKVEIDCRPSLREYLAGARRAPSALRWLVRGHWRNQAVGAGRQQHKLLWIEPHWKGKDGAPVLMRPHEVHA